MAKKREKCELILSHFSSSERTEENERRKEQKNEEMKRIWKRDKRKEQRKVHTQKNFCFKF